MAALQEATDHIPAHPAEADHSELHCFCPPWRNDIPVSRSTMRRKIRLHLPLKQIHKLTIAPGDLGNGLIARRPFAPPDDQRIPKTVRPIANPRTPAQLLRMM
jgi:hypothetical protein